MSLIEKLKQYYNSLSVQKKVVIWFTLVNFFSKSISLIMTPIFTRLLTPQQYGLYSVYHAWNDVIVIFVTLNLHNAVMNNAFMKSEYTKEEVVSSFQGLSLCLSIIWLILYTLTRSFWYNIIELPPQVIILMFIGFIFTPPYHYWQIYKRYQYDYKKMSMVSVLAILTTPLLSLVFVAIAPSEAKGAARIYGVIIAQIVIGAIFYFINWTKDHTFYNVKLWKFALAFNIPMIPHFLSLTILNQSDRIMIAAFYSTSEAGIYSVAYSASSLIMMFTSAINTALVPWSYEQLNNRNFKGLAQMFYKVLFALEFIIVILISFAPEVIYMLAGAKYSEAVYLIPTLSAGVFFSYMYQVIARVGLFYGKTRYTLIGTIVAAVFNLSTNYIFIPIFGYQAAGYTTLASYMLLCLLHYFFYKIVCRKYLDNARVYSSKILAIISAFILVIAILMTFLYDYPFARIFIIFCVALALIIFRNKIAEFVKGILSMRVGDK